MRFKKIVLFALGVAGVMALVLSFRKPKA